MSRQANARASPWPPRDTRRKRIVPLKRISPPHPSEYYIILHITYPVCTTHNLSFLANRKFTIDMYNKNAYTNLNGSPQTHTVSYADKS